MLQSCRLHLLSFTFRLVQSLLLLFGKLTESAGTFLYKTIVMPALVNIKPAVMQLYLLKMATIFHKKNQASRKEPDFTKNMNLLCPADNP